MSKQQVVEFFQTASKDEALAEKLKVFTSRSSILALAAEYGYEFTEEALLQFKRERLHESWNQLEELTARQLEIVAGGQQGTISGGSGGFRVSTVNIVSLINPGDSFCQILKLPTHYEDPLCTIADDLC